ncbi:hypothetical protein NDU88_007079, partial [Pleurodeles waltl]
RQHCRLEGGVQHTRRPWTTWRRWAQPSSLRRSSQGFKDRTAQTTTRQRTCRVSHMGNYNAIMLT